MREGLLGGAGAGAGAGARAAAAAAAGTGRRIIRGVQQCPAVVFF